MQQPQLKIIFIGYSESPTSRGSLRRPCGSRVWLAGGGVLKGHQEIETTGGTYLHKPLQFEEVAHGIVVVCKSHRIDHQDERPSRADTEGR